MQDREFQEPKGTHLKVIDYITQEIKRGDLKVGSVLPPERALAEQLDVSRNSVREAIRVMEIMGTVVSTQGAGHFISSNFESTLVETLSLMFYLKELSFQEISQLRSALERQALILAVENATAEQIEELERIDAQLDRGSLSEQENVALDKQLHYLIAKISGNDLIFSILEALSEVMDRFIADLRSDIMSEETRKEKLTKTHHRLVAAIVDKDLEDGLAAIEEHFALVDERLDARTKDA
jgi:GntR family transcriptional repressor for pyruvate dehydrogenase complex